MIEFLCRHNQAHVKEIRLDNFKYKIEEKVEIQIKESFLVNAKTTFFFFIQLKPTSLYLLILLFHFYFTSNTGRKILFK